MAKTLGLHVGDTPEDAELEKRIRKEAKAHYADKTSAFLRAAAERYFESRSPDAMSGGILVELTQRLLGELDAESMAQAMEGKDQRQKLRVMLERILCEEFDLDLYADEYLRANVRQGSDPEAAKQEREKHLLKLGEMAAENYLNYRSRRYKKSASEGSAFGVTIAPNQNIHSPAIKQPVKKRA